VGVPQRVSVDALIGRQPGLEPQAREQMADVGSGELRAVERAEHVPPADKTELAPALEPQLAPGGCGWSFAGPRTRTSDRGPLPTVVEANTA